MIPLFIVVMIDKQKLSTFSQDVIQEYCVIQRSTIA